MTGIQLKFLRFSGPSVEPMILEFDEGLNIVYGASDTGKSLTAKIILFMLSASSSLPDIGEISRYTGAWLGVRLGGRDVTLFRSTRGGPFSLHDGLVLDDEQAGGLVLDDKAAFGRTDTVSHLLLDAIGLDGRVIVRDGNGKKDNLHLRLIAPYIVVSEEQIISERSPVLYTGARTERTLESNLFRLLLTGTDDSDMLEVQKPSERRVAKAAKLEIVEEMIQQIDAELGEKAVSRSDAEEQFSRLSTTIENVFEGLREYQRQLDAAVSERRALMDRRGEYESRLQELGVTIARFSRLDDVYRSDLDRLQSLEEGGYMLVAMAGMECPVCGATPESHRHEHEALEIESAYKAAAAEARKIEIERRELGQTLTLLTADASGHAGRLNAIGTSLGAVETEISRLRPLEADARRSYEELWSQRASLEKIIELQSRREKLVARRDEIKRQPTKREGGKPVVGPDATTTYAFGEIVVEVLKAWKFPGAERTQFDREMLDIAIGGKARSAHGKGVRALLHSAFNVALLIFCHRNQLPHPGLLVLDTPLLTYREPMTSRHGSLSEDEEVLKAAGIAHHFYSHLASLKGIAQFIVLENVDPPASARPIARIETFTRVVGQGRYGLFPTD
ncbi:hypothetical protein [Rhizobium sp. 11515TR]|uniref:hypothetical protein n=1 Tax=Rhizobium sp. 11515TR TaxID=2028343 RepID=UPI000BA8B56C|nr:hypothetical protein [Rhizobium sp. 11515TR]ASW06414.1 hypothetical protein CKA34_11295 [Rhizobium sp. 11515TR]